MNKDISTYRISAFDLLFFGTGRPFTMEDESWAQGIFPPFPSTLYGFLRSIFFENNIGELKLANQDQDPTKNLIIHGFVLEKEENGIFEALYPIPNYFLIDSDKAIKKLNIEKNDLKSNYTFSLKLTAPSNLEGKQESTTEFHYFTKTNLEKFLRGETIKEYIDLRKYLTNENRIGISKNHKTGKAAEGKLYRLQLTHLNKLSDDFTSDVKINFKVSVSGMELPERHLRTLGGEGKIGILNKTDIDPFNLPKTIDDEAFIYFVTPAIFEDGLYPTEVFKTYDITVQCIANANPMYVSGWDIKSNQPKTAKKALPAGTLLFVRFEDKTKKDQFIGLFQGKVLTDNDNKDTSYTKQGFNNIYIGNY